MSAIGPRANGVVDSCELVRIALPSRVDIWVQLSEVLLVGCHNHVGYAIGD